MMNRIGVLVMAGLMLVCGLVGYGIGRKDARDRYVRWDTHGRRVIGWQWNADGPVIEFCPYGEMVEGGDGKTYAAVPQNVESLAHTDALMITPHRWDIRWRDNLPSEGDDGGMMIYNGDTMIYDGDPRKIWFRLEEYHPPELGE